MKDNPTKIIIVEDEALIAAELKSTLKILGHRVVGHAMNGDKALDLFAKEDADLILLDINIKGTLNGIDLAKVIRKKYHVPFIYITSFSDKTTLDEVKDTLPYGYIVKPFNENDLKVNIELALFKFGTEQAKRSFTKGSLERKLNVNFTNKEYEILIGFKDGLTYKEVGERLYISVNTVKTYQKRLFQLLSVGSKYELLELVRV